jgi:hypothetical protein
MKNDMHTKRKTLISDIREDVIKLGQEYVCDIKEIHGLENIPEGIRCDSLLSLQLPSIYIKAAGIAVGEREFYLCYAPKHALLFIVETEMGKRVETHYRAQYGANDNYDSTTKVQRIVWVYPVDSPRAKDPTIANHLKWYLP